MSPEQTSELLLKSVERGQNFDSQSLIFPTYIFKLESESSINVLSQILSLNDDNIVTNNAFHCGKSSFTNLGF